MTRLLLTFGLLGLLPGCSIKEEAKTVDSSNMVDTPLMKESPNSGMENEDSILHENATLHHFSSLADKDSFKIYITGKSIKDGHVRFQILSGSGRILLDETFPTYMLIGYGLTTDNPTDKEQEDYIKKRVDEFFNEDNFHQPAISNDDSFEEDYSNKGIWNDIKSDNRAIGFYYLVGEEDGRQIAYSKKLEKVVLYFNCC